MSAETQNIHSTLSQPIAISDGFHCSDLSTKTGAVDATVDAVQKKALGYFKLWLAEWRLIGKVGWKRDTAAIAPKPVNAFAKGSGRI